ncbi:type II toxin-antitoxin system RelE/ParE family toxin, partial [Pantoea agglomerans]|uniref:type II toxin-antitoxin system RelE/ParE family toxin n=1 Tax=Enterobacter agglomerans TaxID=549 RepID=UPI003BFA6849
MGSCATPSANGGVKFITIDYLQQCHLERIADYIARDNPCRALSFVMELRDKCMSLANLHQTFPLVQRYEHHNIRRRVYKNYLIFYRLNVAPLQGERHCFAVPMVFMAF